MTMGQTLLKQAGHWVGRGAVLLGFAAGVVVLMLWLAGKFSPKVPATTAAGGIGTPIGEGQIVRAQRIRHKSP